jgi:hypothetical protein
LANIELPLLVLEGSDYVFDTVEAKHGLVILTQSCDIVRDHAHRPFVQVAGLVPATDGEIARAIAGETPSRIYMEKLQGMGLLIDLDVSATVTKESVSKWPRVCGCETDEQQRRFSAALGRHRQRFAFPNEFNELVKPVRRWMESKRSAASPFGNFVRAIKEVRIRTDNWEKPQSLEFILLLNEEVPEAEKRDWDKAISTLQGKAIHEAYPAAEFSMITYDDISAREYLTSDRLDWDGLSEA